MYDVSAYRIPARRLASLDLRRVFAAVIAGAAWFALTVQIAYDIEEARTNNTSVATSLVQFFSFFTIQTNVLVALILTLSCFAPRSDRFLANVSVQSAVATYIVIVGVVYTLLLRHLWNPQGLQLVADRLLHDAIPLLYVMYWLVFMPKGSIRTVDPLLWLIYPLLYFGYILVRGATSGAYPYPFVDVARLGYREVLINASMFLGAFFALGVTFAGIDRAMSGYGADREASLAEQPNSDK